jgi:hypothetical protein
MRKSLVLFALLGCSSKTANDAPDASTGDRPPVRAPASHAPLATPVGTVTHVTLQPTCTIPGPVGSGMQPGFRCAVLTVSCPGIDDAQVDVALTPGTATKGVIVTHAGSSGTTFENNQLAVAMFQKGWALAQIAWHLPWECPKHTATDCATDTTPVPQRAGIVEAACRPATVMKWIHDSATAADGTPFVAAGKPYCGHGASGGSGAFWYALTRYGLGAQLDHVVLAASTPFGRIDVGCNPASKSTMVPAPCDNVTPPGVFVNFTNNNTTTDRAFNKWLSTSSCDVSPSADEVALYARSSVVAPGADFTFPTPVTTYDCVDQATLNVVPGAGHFVHDALRANDPAGAKWRGACAVNGVNGTCTGEGAFQDPALLQAATSELDGQCRPLAR